MFENAQEKFGGAGEVRAGMEIDAAALEAWMKASIPDFHGPLQIGQFRGGQSNPTYRLSTPARGYVLRRKPPGQILQSAHAVDREFRVISALSATDYPVPSVYGFCDNAAVLGTPFYVMELVDGRVLWEPSLGEMTPASRAQHFEALVDTLARLHRLDYVALGLGDYGRPTGYVSRQVQRWSRQYVEDKDAGRVPAMDRMIEWLHAHMPKEDGTATIVHGDYSRTNVLFHPDRPVIRAVLDWELSTIGDPLSDLGYHLMMYWLPPEAGGHAGLDIEQLGIPSFEAYLASYCRRVERESAANILFYVAFNLFRLAAIIHGIRGRVARGNASSAHARDAAARVELIADLAWHVAQEAG